MTVSAPTTDLPGAALLAGIAAVQALVTTNASPAAQSAQVQQLNALQTEAVDHFMATYWVSADSILAVLPPATTGYCGAHISDALNQIAARAEKVAVIVARGLPVSPVGNEAPQYSVAYPLTQVPDTYWYQLQLQLVDFCMANAVLPASLILSTLVGAQTYPFNYISDYTFYQYDIDN